jgi:ribosome-associated protein
VDLLVERGGVRVLLPESDLSWTAVRASGPGGQHVNKVATKVVLRFDLAGTRALAPDVKERLRWLAGRRVDALGAIVIVSQRTRDRALNLRDARAKLAALVAAALIPPRPRRPTHPSRAAVRRRLDDKRRRAERKRSRRSAGDEG